MLEQVHCLKNLSKNSTQPLEESEKRTNPVKTNQKVFSHDFVGNVYVPRYMFSMSFSDPKKKKEKKDKKDKKKDKREIS